MEENTTGADPIVSKIAEYARKTNHNKGLVMGIIQKAKNDRTIAEASIEALSLRADLVAETYDINAYLADLNSKLAKQKRTRLDQKINPTQGGHSQVRYQNGPDRNVAIAAEMADLTKITETIGGYQSFLKGMIETLDKLGYSIKSRIDLENLGFT